MCKTDKRNTCYIQYVEFPVVKLYAIANFTWYVFGNGLESSDLPCQMIPALKNI